MEIKLTGLIETSNAMYEIQSYNKEQKTFQGIKVNPVYGFARKNGKVTNIIFDKVTKYHEFRINGKEVELNKKAITEAIENEYIVPNKCETCKAGRKIQNRNLVWFECSLENDPKTCKWSI